MISTALWKGTINYLRNIAIDMKVHLWHFPICRHSLADPQRVSSENVKTETRLTLISFQETAINKSNLFVFEKIRVCWCLYYVPVYERPFDGQQSLRVYSWRADFKDIEAVSRRTGQTEICDEMELRSPFWPHQLKLLPSAVQLGITDFVTCQWKSYFIRPFDHRTFLIDWCWVVHAIWRTFSCIRGDP